MQVNLWEQGVDLMLYGMGTVFVFLTLLVIGTMIMSNIVSRFFAEEPEPVLAPVGGSQSQTVNKSTLAVIQAAIHAHRAKHQK
ncbi:OadG family protein [Teredinibacter haidensis]|uniref:OadG family protein n=1 Tax=Teredinibacter haidensis TaxID=2731755 RepID=UPI0009490104|nr:OadG family protein [Teredinibacter haidensis]